MIKDAIAACATDAYAAASLRHDGNKKFSGKEYTAAVEAYTEGTRRILLLVKCIPRRLELNLIKQHNWSLVVSAIRLHDSDPLLWSNRAAARLALRDSGSALKDAMQGARHVNLIKGY